MTVDPVDRRFFVTPAPLGCLRDRRGLRHVQQDVLNAAVGAARWVDLGSGRRVLSLSGHGARTLRRIGQVEDASADVFPLQRDGWR